MEVHKCIRYGQFPCFGRHYECWKVYKGFRATYAPHPDYVYFKEGIVYFNRTMQNRLLQLLQQHDFVVEETRCWIGLPAVQNFPLKRTLTTNSSAAGYLYRARMGSNSNTKTPETHNLDAQTSLNCFERRGDATPWQTCPSPNYFETCDRHKILDELILCIKL